MTQTPGRAQHTAGALLWAPTPSPPTPPTVALGPSHSPEHRGSVGSGRLSGPHTLQGLGRNRNPRQQWRPDSSETPELPSRPQTREATWRPWAQWVPDGTECPERIRRAPGGISNRSPALTPQDEDIEEPLPTPERSFWGFSSRRPLAASQEGRHAPGPCPHTQPARPLLTARFVLFMSLHSHRL